MAFRSIKETSVGFVGLHNLPKTIFEIEKIFEEVEELDAIYIISQKVTIISNERYQKMVDFICGMQKIIERNEEILEFDRIYKNVSIVREMEEKNKLFWDNLAKKDAQQKSGDT